MNCRISKSWRSASRDVVLAGALVLAAGAAAAAQRCVVQAANRFTLPVALLEAVVTQESAQRCPARHPRNADGSYDIGCAGINSTWLPLLTHRFHLTEQDLTDPCINIHVGAWLLARNFVQYGDHWRAVGAYNARSETKRMEYVWRIVSHLRRSSSR